MRAVIAADQEDVPRWTGNPFVAESDVSELDDAVPPLTIIPASYGVKRSIHFASKSKPRPATIYKDKRVEENWAFLKTVPVDQITQLPPLSRCPSLMSTVSSRNSSTRSARSSIFDPAEDFKSDWDGACRASFSSDFCKPRVSTDVQLTQTGESSALRCPVKSCSKQFTRPADRKRHIFRHFTGVLRCGFCTENDVTFSQSSDRVGLFMTHLIKEHGASGHPQTLTSDAEKLSKIEPAALHRTNSRLSFEGPYATCSVCIEPFGAQGYYEHLRGCIFREITRNEDTHTELADDEVVHNSFEHDLELSNELTCEHTFVAKTEEVHNAFQYASHLTPPELCTRTIESDCEDILELTASSRCLSLTSSKAAESSEEETDWTEEQTSRESSPGTSQLPRRLSPAKSKVVNAIMQDFQRLFAQGLRTHACGENSSSCSWSNNTSIYSTSSFVSRKRSLSGGGSTPPDKDDGDSNKRRRRPESKADGKKSVVDLRFACPYYKRNPGRHQTFTSCRDPGFTTVARLKYELHHCGLELYAN